MILTKFSVGLCTHSITGPFSSRNVSASVFSPSLMATTIHQENAAWQFTPISRQSSSVIFICFPDPKECFYRRGPVFSQQWRYDRLVWISCPAFGWHRSIAAANFPLGILFGGFCVVVVCLGFFGVLFNTILPCQRDFFSSTAVKGLLPSMEKSINE